MAVNRGLKGGTAGYYTHRRSVRPEFIQVCADREVALWARFFEIIERRAVSDEPCQQENRAVARQSESTRGQVRCSQRDHAECEEADPACEKATEEWL